MITRSKLEGMSEVAVLAHSQVDLTLLALTVGTAEYRETPLFNFETKTLRIKISNATNSTKGFSCRIILKRIILKACGCVEAWYVFLRMTPARLQVL